MASDGNYGLGVDFQPGLQEGLINNRGAKMIHEYGVACTCRVEDVYASTLGDGKDNRRDPFCPRCGNSGWLYRDPVLITGIITSIRQQNNFHDIGEAQPGDASFSPHVSSLDCTKGRRRIGQSDRFTATWSQPLHEGQIIVRGAGTMNENKGLTTHLSDDEDRLWYEPASAIWCEDANDIVYYEKADFVFGPGKIIKWIGNKPDPGVRYSIKYNAFFEWLAWQAPQERVDRDGKDLGPLVMLRKRHAVIINTDPKADSPVAIQTDRQSLQSIITC